MKEKESLDVDVIQKSIGAYGRFHIFFTAAIFLGKFAIAWHQLAIVILAPPAKFECSNSSIPKCSADCPAHDFDKSIFQETIITQWDLVCDNAQLTNVAQLTVMFGILLGNVIFGYLSDRFGRRIPLIWAIILQVITGVAAAFAPWFWLFIVLRMLCAISTGGTMLTSFILLMELVGEEYRTIVGIFFQTLFYVGQALLGLFGYLIRDWHYIQMTISIPSAILISYYWIVPESPRWLLAMGRVDKSVDILQKIAKHNRLATYNIKENVVNYLKSNTNNNQIAGNAYDLIRTRTIRIWTICMCINWLAVGMAFFGVAQYMGHIGGDMFLNIAIGGIVQLPGTFIIIPMLNRLGRKWTLMLTNTLCGASLLLITVLPTEPVMATTILASLGMLCISMSFTVIYIYAGEIFPTVIRNVGMGTSSMFSRIGSMTAPFVAGLNTVDLWLPPLIFGIAALVGTLACLWLPETLNCKLPDTIEEAEQLGKTTILLNELSSKRFKDRDDSSKSAK